MCEFFKVPPSSPLIQNLTISEKFWLLINIHKTEEEEIEKTKLLCKFMRPEAFLEENSKVTVSDDFISSIEEKIGRPLTEEEKSKIKEEAPSEDLDVIEPVVKE